MHITTLTIDAFPSADIDAFLEEALRLYVDVADGNPLVYVPAATTFAMVSFKTSAIGIRTQLALRHPGHYGDNMPRNFGSPRELVVYMGSFKSAQPTGR